MDHIAVIDFGSQYTQLIVRKIRELGFFSRLYLPDDFESNDSIKGVILSGGPKSVLDRNSPRIDRAKLRDDVPILGICYGMQLLAYMNNGRVARSETSEYGRMEIKIDRRSRLFRGVPGSIKVWMSHSDSVYLSRRGGLTATSHSKTGLISSMEHSTRPVYALQFHPEVHHTDYGRIILKNFLFDICGVRKNWKASDIINDIIKQIRNEVGNDSCLCAISGGVDSTAAAVIANKALGNRLKCVFVDNGLLRKDEYRSTTRLLRELGLNLFPVDVGRLFLSRLKGVANPENKRKIIGKSFIDVFSEISRTKFRDCRYLIQGTLYPDVIESVSPTGAVSSTIKTHHNVGGLPKDLKFRIIEPFRYMFKDEVRKVARKAGLPEGFVTRQPFPGPGLAVRIIGEVTPDKIRILQDADAVVRDVISRSRTSAGLWQFFAVLLPVKSVGVEGDERKYKYVVAVRAVTSRDAMTADWARLPHSLLQELAEKIVNSNKYVGRVVYDITTKPPATIEWE